MPRPKKEIPFEDIKGLKTLLDQGKTQEEISIYYKEHGINIDQVTISRRIKEMMELE
jgi:arginine repressor